MPWWKRALGRSRREPEDVDTALRHALLCVLDRDLDEAEAALAHACQLDSSGVDPYLALARLYRMRGEIGRAIRIHQNLLLRKGLSPDQTVVALADLAADFRKGGFLQRAIASYEEVLAHDSRHVGALRALVDLFADVRDHDRAIAMARRLAKVDPEQARGAPGEAELLVASAEAAHAQGRSDDARRALKRALRRSPRLAKAWVALGELEAERGRTRAALAAWAKAPEIDRQTGPLVYPRLAASYAALDRARDFETYLARQIEERPDDGAARVALANALAARGESEQALAELRRRLEADPDDLAARAALGRILLGEAREAEVAKAHAELLDVLERRGSLRRSEALS